MDPIDKAKRAMGSLEQKVSGLPGVAAYRDKEMRRDADKKLRETLAQRLEEQRRRLTEIQNQLLGSGGLQWLDDVERLGTRLQTLIDRIRTAAYGYAGFFDVQKVEEAELDRLASHDKDLFDNLGPLDEAIGKVGEAVASNQGITEAIQAVAALIAKLNDDFGRRAQSMVAPE